jgi:hypothetical protein
MAEIIRRIVKEISRRAGRLLAKNSIAEEDRVACRLSHRGVNRGRMGQAIATIEAMDAISPAGLKESGF